LGIALGHSKSLYFVNHYVQFTLLFFVFSRLVMSDIRRGAYNRALVLLAATSLIMIEPTRHVVVDTGYYLGYVPLHPVGVGGPCVGGPCVGGPCVGGPCVGGPCVGGPCIGGAHHTHHRFDFAHFMKWAQYLGYALLLSAVFKDVVCAIVSAAMPVRGDQSEDSEEKAA